MIRIKKAIKKNPRRTIVLGFAAVILTGAVILSLPVSSLDGKGTAFIDSLFISTSAVCVTGLATVDLANTFNVFGDAVIAMLVQIGGLGITSIGVITILLARGKVSMGGRKLAQEAFNLPSGKNIVSILKAIALITFAFEGTGVILSYIAFSGRFTALKTFGISVFHSVSAFNNAGFDLFGDFKSLADYHDDPMVNIVTALLIIFGGLGFFVNMEIISKRSFRKFSLHSKVVISMTVFLIVSGMLLIMFTEKTTLLGAFFMSVTARTAGFATENIGNYSNAGLLVLIVLMYIGASPGSTGGGIKTTTAFVLIRNMRNVTLNKSCAAFKRKISDDTVRKALVVAGLALLSIMFSTFIVSVLESQFSLSQILTEVTSAFATVGLSTGITPQLCSASKLMLIITMFIGRLGPLTIVTLWWKQNRPKAEYVSEIINIG